MVGASREIVSRVLKDMRDSGLIRRDKRKIIVLDRARHGYVVDFADLHFGAFRPFLVFNVGDAAISIGVVILLVRAFLARNESPEETIEHA